MEINHQNKSIIIFKYYLFIIFCMSCFIYFWLFAYDTGFTYEPIKGWLNPVNIHDHYVYLSYIDEIEKTGDWVTLSGLNNNFGISLVYYCIHTILEQIDLELNYETLALVVNLIIMMYAMRVYSSIIYKLGLNPVWTLTFFVMSPLLYFAQLINKDSFTILIILLAINYSISKQWRQFFILTILSMLIRFQLPALLLLYLFFVVGKKNHVLKFICVYIFLSLMNGVLAKYQIDFFNESTLSDGMSYLVYSLNTKYYIGSLLLNPVRAIQYIHDALISFDFINGEVIDVGRMKNIPQVIFLLLLSPFLINVILNYRFYMGKKEKYLLAMINAFFGIWLFNPTINLRYFILFFPILQILGICMYINYRKRGSLING
ncbi:hypothetical protein SOM82_04740 [Lelliottia sp. CFBP8978]|nr:hypothetical protein [Lelliottia sp. CFBP8978]